LPSKTVNIIKQQHWTQWNYYKQRD